MHHALLPVLCKRTVPFLLLFLLYTPALFSQQAVNNHTLDSVKSYLERNYVGFADKVNKQTQLAYHMHVKQSYAYAKQAVTATDQYFVIRHFISFFKDNHLSIDFLSDTSYKETIELDEKQIQQLYNTKTNSIEGIYYTGDSTYKVALIKSKKGLRSFAAVILTSKASSWKKGQVKFELIETGVNQYMGKWYNWRHFMSLIPVQFKASNGGLGDQGWYKVGSNPEVEMAPIPIFAEEAKQSTFFKHVNDSTCYIRIKSFDVQNAKLIDSVINANKTVIQAKAKLIIDLRNNGGGGDRSASFLLPIIYTNPVTSVGVDMLSTPDNINAWDSILEQYRNQLPKDVLDNVSKKVHQKDGVERAMVNFTADRTDTLATVWPNPVKVAIVINRYCASATEEFLLAARQSTKTTLVGEASRGVLDFSNVVQKRFSDPAFVLHYPTTRSRRLDVGPGIDNKGIQPDIPINLNSYWLSELLKKW